MVRKFRLPSSSEKQISRKVSLLLESVDRVYPSTRHMMWRSFLHGLFVAIGASVGFSLLIGLVTFIISQAKGISPLKDAIENTQIEKMLPNDNPLNNQQ